MWDVKRGSCSHCDVADAMKWATNNTLGDSCESDQDPLTWWRTTIMSGLVVDDVDHLQPCALFIMDPLFSSGRSIFGGSFRWTMFKRYARVPFGEAKKHRLRLLRKDVKQVLEAHRNLSDSKHHQVKFDDQQESKLQSRLTSLKPCSVDSILQDLGYNHLTSEARARMSPVQRDLRILLVEHIQDSFQTVVSNLDRASPACQPSLTSLLFSAADVLSIAEMIIHFVKHVGTEFD
jgi:hypothetical protein